MVFEKVKNVVVAQLGIDESEVTMESNFKDDLGIDSLEIFEIVMALEEQFNIEIPNEDLEGISTIDGIVKYIQEK